MSVIDLDAPELSPQALGEAARALSDKAWATAVIEKWQHETTKPYFRSWIFQLGLVAANSLGRAEEFIPVYQRFLANADSDTKPDWHEALTDKVRSSNMLSQSGRLGQDVESFTEEFKRTVTALGPPGLGPVIDIGCAGGAYAINMAKLGFQVLGTDHHAGIIEEAKRNAATTGVTDKATFVVDDACASKIADGAYSRAICIGVTPCLPNNAAFGSLMSHLDRVTRRSGSSAAERRVVLGSNRWGPSRLSALRGILADAASDPERAIHRLNHIQVSWWLNPSQLDVIKRYFSNTKIYNETSSPVDGVRIDLLLK
jgi:SAM-dependent methyltransferase